MAYLVNEIDDEKFSIPENETAIGRGAFLKVIEKRVSRKHAVVKYEDGKMFVKPVHNNPTFFCSSSSSEFLPLTKDVWKQLEHGDVIALLPDTLKFTVCIKVDQTQEYDLESCSEEKLLSLGIRRQQQCQQQQCQKIKLIKITLFMILLYCQKMILARTTIIMI